MTDSQVPDAARRTMLGAVVNIEADWCYPDPAQAEPPVPFWIVGFLGQGTATSDDVSMTSVPSFTRLSMVAHVMGNEAGRGGGVSSGVNRGGCFASSWSQTVFINSRELVRHGDLFRMNCAGVGQSAVPTEPCNCYGVLIFVENVPTGEPIGLGGIPEPFLSHLVPNPQLREFMQNPTETVVAVGIDEAQLEARVADFNDAAAERTDLAGRPIPLIGEVNYSRARAGEELSFGMNEAEAQARAEEAASEGLHVFLDLVGLVPAFGEPADLVNGVIYTAEGDEVNAGLSFAAMIPIGGWLASGGKWVQRIPGVGGLVRRAGDVASPVGNWIRRRGEDLQNLFRRGDGGSDGARIVRGPPEISLFPRASEWGGRFVTFDEALVQVGDGDAIFGLAAPQNRDLFSRFHASGAATPQRGDMLDAFMAGDLPLGSQDWFDVVYQYEMQWIDDVIADGGTIYFIRNPGVDYHNAFRDPGLPVIGDGLGAGEVWYAVAAWESMLLSDPRYADHVVNVLLDESHRLDIIPGG